MYFGIWEIPENFENFENFRKLEIFLNFEKN